ncbi:Elongator complex protein 1 [Strongyloides ratti]|uniref:Elongator complex protein 1 n=1 Tax=Strongyloides ratti TaxID=34506 RepID=A0A090MX34_STRRB|nr:Elongator complex protein 1 [Strongyloides ratti]CEF64739.1 Elongator complex protein 1 [Strongyloides ratti]
MKNIQLYEVQSIHGYTNNFDLKDAEAFCFDSLSNIVYVSLPQTIIGIQLETKVITKKISWGDLRINGKGDTNIASFVLIPDEFVIYIVLRNGEISCLSLEDNIFYNKGQLPGKVKSVSWCPGYQTFIACCGNELYYFTRDFELLNQFDIIPTEPGLDNLGVNVGWGSLATQFQGAEGKQKLSKIELEKKPTPIKDYDSVDNVIISWRVDTEYFIVSSVEPTLIQNGEDKCEIMHRVTRVWNNEGKYMSQFENLAGAEPVLAVKPQGNYIATLRVFENERYLRFYERNGQKRHEFNITEQAPPNDLKAIHMSWNSDGSILSICFKGDTYYSIQFWTSSNYVWYMKYHIKTFDQISQFEWDEIKPHNFRYLLRNGMFVSASLDPTKYYSLNTTTFVVDGCKLNVTDFTKGIMPPPMCNYTLTLPNYILCLSQHPDGNVAIITSAPNISLLVKNQDTYTPISIFNLADMDPMALNFFFYDIKFSSPDTISFITHGLEYYIVHFNFTTKKHSIVLSSQKNILLHFPVPSNPNIYIYQLQNGDWFEYNQLTGETKELCLGDSKVVKLASFDSHRTEFLVEEKLLVSLTNTNQLLLNEKIIDSAVGSFRVGKEFLFVITLSNTLFCIPRQQLSKLSALPAKSSGRCVERGSQIVDIDEIGTKVILQMPRGNLETIEPRILLLNKLKKLFDNHKWNEAYIIMKRHRVDLNLFFDNNPKMFLSSIFEFVNDIYNPDALNIFITNLVEESTTGTMFIDYYPSHINQSYPNKVNVICQKILEYFLSIEDSNKSELIKFFSCVLSCYVKQTPRMLKEAFMKIKQIKCTLDKDESYRFVDDSIRHLLYMVDGNTLFKEAIGTYDWEIAINVAECSQRDPKEYTILLNDFRSKEPLSYQRYCVDMYLDNYKSALNNIAITLSEDENNFNFHMDECINLIKLQNLYSYSLTVFQSTPHYTEICKIYAEYLEVKEKYDDAAIMYLKGNVPSKALSCFKKTKNWKFYLEYALEENIDEIVIKNTLEEMSTLSEIKGDHFNSYEIQKFLYEKYDHNVCYLKKMLSLLMISRRWNDASILVIKDSKSDNPVLVQLFKLKLKERSENYKKLFKEWEKTFFEHSNRLIVLRKEKQDKIKELVNASMVDDDFEMQSEASSTISSFSKMSKISTASGRRNKKVQKKKRFVKEGSQYEDISRLFELKKLYAIIDDFQDEMANFLPVLILWDFIDDGKFLQETFIDLLDNIEKNIKIHWPHSINAYHLLGPIHEIYRQSDGTIRMPDAGEMPERIAVESELIPPVIRKNIIWQLDMLK